MTPIMEPDALAAPGARESRKSEYARLHDRELKKVGGSNPAPRRRRSPGGAIIPRRGKARQGISSPSAQS